MPKCAFLIQLVLLALEIRRQRRRLVLLKTIELLISSSPRAPASQHRSGSSGNLVQASRKLLSHFILIPHIMWKHVVLGESRPPCTL